MSMGSSVVQSQSPPPFEDKPRKTSKAIKKKLQFDLMEISNKAGEFSKEEKKKAKGSTRSNKLKVQFNLKAQTIQQEYKRPPGSRLSKVASKQNFDSSAKK